MTDLDRRQVAHAGVPTEGDIDPVTRAFSLSMVISGIRCTLTYVVFPWILPLVGVAGGIGPVVGLGVGVLAIACNVASIRRFWAADHKWKVAISVINGAVIVLLLILIAMDLGELFS